MEKKYYVYGLFNKSEPARIRYVGLTSHTPEKRLKGSLGQAKHTNRKLPLFLWIRKYGEERIGVRTLAVLESEDLMKAKEIELIAHYRSLGEADLNVTDGGEAANGLVWSEEQRATHRERMTGEGNPMFGVKRPPGFMNWVGSHERRPLSEEEIAMRRAHMISLHTPENRKKAGDSLRKTLSDPARRKAMSERTSGKNNPMFGVRATDEERDRMSDYNSKKLNRESVIELKKRVRDGEPRKLIAEEYGIKLGSLHHIMQGHRWPGVP